MSKLLKNLTNPQKSIWLTNTFYQSSSLSNLGGTLLIHQKVDFDLLDKAINIFIKQNDGMRIIFELINGTAYQYVQEYFYKKLPIYEVNSNEELALLEQNFIHTKFNISESFLYEFKLIKLKNGTGGFNITLHHLIADAWSMSLLVNEIIDIYSNLLENENFEYEAKPSYLEYIENEAKYLNSEKFDKDAQFWEGLFNNTCPTCVSFSQKNSQNTSPEAKRKIFLLNNSKEISDFCKEHDISNFTFLMTVFSLYLRRISGVNDIILGSPILNRNGIKEKNMFGLFVNTLPIKVEVHDDISFLDLAKQVSDSQFSMFRHHKYPYSELLEFVRKKYKISNNLYDTIISYQNARNNSKTSNIEYSTNWDFNGSLSNSLDIHIYDMDNTGILNLFYDYKVEKFEESEIDDIHNRILHIIDQVMDNPNLLIQEIEIVTNEEKNLLLNTFNDTKLDYPKDKTINELFEEQCRITPNKVAIAFGDKTLTYEELNKKANQLARFLRDEKKVQPNSFVGILTKRSLEMAVGILAIVKSGAAYVPIDPEYPEERIKYMIEDSLAKTILVDESTEKLHDLNDYVNIDFSNEKIYNTYSSDNLEVINKPSDLMYLIYTSGSTGKPKGVMLMHRNVNNFIHGLTNIIDFSSDKVIVSVTTICFDIFVTEFWGGLLKGLTVVIANEQEQNITYDLNKLCLKYNVNMIQTTPSRFGILLDDENNLQFMNNITDIIVGGESLPKKLLHKFYNYPWATVYNIYGPTETTVMSSIKKSPKEENITIGRPLANTKIYILDDNYNLMPPNIPGNLFIGGDGVGKGYFNRPDLNEKSFIASPFDDSILYNTNDLAYIGKDGDIVHLGRSDFQAKVHGFRVELGEIENLIMKIPTINNAVVLLQDGNLNAFVTSDKKIDTKEIISYLMKLLPHYMIPKTITKIKEIPLTPNGKIDRKSSIFKISNDVIIENKITPRNDKEELLYNLIKDTLHLDLGVTDNIFECGADSLMIIKLVSKLYLYKINLSVQDFYNNPSIEAIARKLTSNKKVVPSIKNDYEHLTNIAEIKKPLEDPFYLKKPNNILLTGVTGFLGIHVLEYLINNSNFNVYCIIRSKDNKNPMERLIDRLNYYFDGKYINLINERIFILESNITSHYFDMSKEDYNKLGSIISRVIHCAADVRHYGNYHLSEKINIQATDNIIRFCLDFNILLNHVSTMTVSGYGLVNVEYDGIFDEEKFYINQNYKDNIYVKTKFIAEEEIYRASKNGLIANIYRIGNLTNRFSDCKFQFNSYENGFLNKLKAIKNLGMLPMDLKNYELEFTPVDICADAIVKLSVSNNKDYNINVFHLYNNNYVPMNIITNLFEENNIHINYLENEDFEKNLATILANSKATPGFLEYFSSNELPNLTNNLFSNDSTLKILNLLGFSWPKITKEYINNIIRRI